MLRRSVPSALAVMVVGLWSSVAVAQIGFHDQVTPVGTVSGWALDPDAPLRQLDVKIYIGGPIGTGSLLGTTRANAARGDVNRATGHAGNHGFNFEIPAAALTGTQPIYAYAVKGQKEILLAGSPKMASVPTIQERHPNLGSLWFNPPIGPAFDWKDLYRKPELWRRARQKVSVLQIQDWALGSSVLPDHELIGMVEALAKLDLRLALETGVVKPWGCSASSVLPIALSYMQRLTQFRGTVDYIAMDEPLVARAAAPSGCGLTIDEIARETAAYIGAVKKGYPGVEIGDIEPWPSISKDELKQWIIKIDQKSEHKLAFFRLDVDCDLAVRDHHRMSDLREIADFVRSKGIPFSIIVPALSQISDTSARKYGLLCAARIHEATSIDNAIVQSWEAYPKSNLPDDAQNTLTAILNEYASEYPPTMIHGAIKAAQSRTPDPLSPVN